MQCKPRGIAHVANGWAGDEELKIVMRQSSNSSNTDWPLGSVQTKLTSC